MNLIKSKCEKILIAALIRDIVPQASIKNQADSAVSFKKAFNTFFENVDDIAELIKDGEPDTLEKQILYIAERLAEGNPSQSQMDSSTPLAAISSKVEFRTERAKTKYYHADTLKVEKDVLFPSDISSVPGDISLTFWDRFVQKAHQLQKYSASAFISLGASFSMI